MLYCLVFAFMLLSECHIGETHEQALRTKMSCPKYCSCSYKPSVLYIDCSFKNLQVIPDFSVVEDGSIPIDIYLNGNRIPHVFGTSFWYIGARLRSLQISQNQVPFEVAPQAFTQSHYKIKNLKLSPIRGDLPKNLRNVFDSKHLERLFIETGLQTSTVLDVPLNVGMRESNLQVLHVINSGVSFVGQRTMAGLRLIELALSDNHLMEFPSVLWYMLSETLHVLYLDGNFITVLKPSQFPSACKLQVLDLQDNHISVIHKGTIDKCDNLEDLNLAGNKQLVSVDPSIFVNFKYLKLDVQNTEFVDFEQFESDNFYEILAFGDNQNCNCRDRLRSLMVLGRTLKGRCRHDTTGEVLDVHVACAGVYSTYPGDLSNDAKIAKDDQFSGEDTISTDGPLLNEHYTFRKRCRDRAFPQQTPKGSKRWQGGLWKIMNELFESMYAPSGSRDRVQDSFNQQRRKDLRFSTNFYTDTTGKRVDIRAEEEFPGENHYSEDRSSPYVDFDEHREQRELTHPRLHHNTMPEKVRLSHHERHIRYEQEENWQHTHAKQQPRHERHIRYEQEDNWQHIHAKQKPRHARQAMHHEKQASGVPPHMQKEQMRFQGNEDHHGRELGNLDLSRLEDHDISNQQPEVIYFTPEPLSTKPHSTGQVPESPPEPNVKDNETGHPATPTWAFSLVFLACWINVFLSFRVMAILGNKTKLVIFLEEFYEKMELSSEAFLDRIHELYVR